MKTVKIADVTLRQGTMASGTALSFKEKIEIARQLQRLDVDVIEIPQTMMSMSPPMKEVERLIRAREMLHVHNTCARWCFGNVRCAVDGNENRSIGRIDIAVAWIIAMATAMVKMGQPADLADAIESGAFSL